MKAALIAVTLALAAAGCGREDELGPAAGGEPVRTPEGDSGRAPDGGSAPAPASDPAPPPDGWREHVDERRGFRLSLPPGWHMAEPDPANAGGDPVEILLAATFPPGESQGLCRSLPGVPPDQALVTLQERGRGAYGIRSFPPRPARFEPDPALPGSSTWPYCIHGDDQPPVPMLDYWFGFGDAGRAFHVFVGVGREAPPELRLEAFEILDTLWFDPEVKPDWRFSG